MKNTEPLPESPTAAGPFTGLFIAMMEAMMQSVGGNTSELQRELLRLNGEAAFAHPTLSRYAKGKTFPDLPDMDKLYMAAVAKLPPEEQERLKSMMDDIGAQLNRHWLSIA